MKKIFYIMITCLMFFYFIDVNAVTVKPNCSGSYQVGDVFDVYINISRGNNEPTVSAVDGLFSYDENILSLQSQNILLNSWTQLSMVSNNAMFNYSNMMFNNLITGTSTNVAKLSFKINKEFSTTSLTIKNLNGTDGDANTISSVSGGSCTISFKQVQENVAQQTDSRSSVNTLKSLVLSSGSIDFKSTKNNYDVVVDNDVETVEISSELSDVKASYVNGYGNRKVDLKVGNNTVLIKVKAENQSVRTYKLNINRLEDLENVKMINNILIENYNLNFDSDIYEYDLKINTENKLKINVDLVNENSSAEVTGNSNLNDGSVITITAADKNGNTKVYKINIQKDVVNDLQEDTSDVKQESKNEGRNVWFICSIVLNIVLILIIGGYITYKAIKKM